MNRQAPVSRPMLRYARPLFWSRKKELPLAKVKTNPVETAVGTAILAVLACIAAGMLIAQSRFDPAFFTAMTAKVETIPSPESEGLSAVPAASPGTSALLDPIPEGMSVLTPVETFNSETLSEKIDGKAELYLSSGFVSMASQRFVLNESPDSWLEVYVYDMGNMRNAFSVWSAQRRSDAEKSDITPFSYATANALFFVDGAKYVEIVGAAEGFSGAILALGKSIVSREGVETREVGELALFPPEGLDAGSVALHASDVFGFDGLNNTFTATYDVGGAGVTAFISQRETPDEALKLASAYHDFLLQNGGKDVAWSVEMLAGAQLVEIFGSFEAIFCSGRVLAGVHEAEAKEPAERLSSVLEKGLREKGK